MSTYRKHAPMISYELRFRHAIISLVTIYSSEEIFSPARRGKKSRRSGHQASLRTIKKPLAMPVA
jgi:NADH:ubiquinone oxidoreductase subunit H